MPGLFLFYRIMADGRNIRLFEKQENPGVQLMLSIFSLE